MLVSSSYWNSSVAIGTCYSVFRTGYSSIFKIVQEWLLFISTHNNIFSYFAEGVAIIGGALDECDHTAQDFRTHWIPIVKFAFEFKPVLLKRHPWLVALLRVCQAHNMNVLEHTHNRWCLAFSSELLQNGEEKLNLIKESYIFDLTDLNTKLGLSHWLEYIKMSILVLTMN